MQSTRIVGIQHRIKATPDGAKVPTKVCILQKNGDIIRYDLADETAELDWVKGQFPTGYRKVTAEDTISDFPEHHVEWKQLETDQRPEDYPPPYLKKK